MISVVICTYNRQEYLPECLAHLADQSANYETYEILIVDNNSSDQTAVIAKDFIASHPKLNCHYILETQQGLSYARNKGIRESNGEIIAFLDDDAFADIDYIVEMQAYFDQYPNVNSIGGKVIPRYESGQPPKWMSKYMAPLVAALDMGKKPKPFRGVKYPIGANMAFRKELFRHVGKFDVELGRRADVLEAGEEKELFSRIKYLQSEIHYVPQVKVAHIIPEKRTEMPYLKKMGIGHGVSEKKRFIKKDIVAKISYCFLELFKWGASVLLAVFYVLIFKFHSAIFLLRFRFWVFKGLIS